MAIKHDTYRSCAICKSRDVRNLALTMTRPLSMGGDVYLCEERTGCRWFDQLLSARTPERKPAPWPE